MKTLGEVIQSGAVRGLKRIPVVQYLWKTDQWDGTLSGYCMIGNKPHYFDLVRDYDNNRERAYGAVELPDLYWSDAQQRRALWQHLDSEGRIQEFFKIYPMESAAKVKAANHLLPCVGYWRQPTRKWG